MKRSRILLCALVSLSASAADDTTRIQKGHDVFQYWCAPCHGRGEGPPGTIALRALYQGAKPALLEERTDLTPELTRHYVRNGVSVMPYFRKTEISDADLNALSNYLAMKK
jgi:mono/diheme cytochrome c family protein